MFIFLVCLLPRQKETFLRGIWFKHLRLKKSHAEIEMGIAELIGDDPSNERSRTFVFEGEGHTLGNALRSVIARYPEVTFCGYTVPHPADDKINFRIQTSGPKAVDILKRGLSDLEEHCTYIMNTFKTEVMNFSAK